MTTRTWMRDPIEAGPVKQAPAVAAPTLAGESRGRLEIMLATAGFAAWAWCALEVLGALFR